MCKNGSSLQGEIWVEANNATGMEVTYGNHLICDLKGRLQSKMTPKFLTWIQGETKEPLM